MIRPILWPWHFNVADRETDGRTDNTNVAIPRSLLSVSRGKNGFKICHKSELKQIGKRTLSVCHLYICMPLMWWLQCILDNLLAQVPWAVSCRPTRVKDGTTIVMRFPPALGAYCRWNSWLWADMDITMMICVQNIGTSTQWTDERYEYCHPITLWSPVSTGWFKKSKPRSFCHNCIRYWSPFKQSI